MNAPRHGHATSILVSALVAVPATVLGGRAAVEEDVAQSAKINLVGMSALYMQTSLA